MVPTTRQPVTDPHATFQQNRDAMMGTVSAPVAEQLDRISIPDTVEAVTGRDGTPNYIRHKPDGSSSWFGGSSMPSLSASEIPGSYDAGNTSIFFPAIGTGWELEEHLQQLPQHCAVLAWDADLVNVRLALGLRDLSENLKKGRLVILGGDDANVSLVAFLEENPGYDIPSKMVIIPYLSEEQISIRADLLNDAARTVSRKRNELAHELRTGFADRPTKSVPDKPRILCSTILPTTEALEWLHRTEQAASSIHPDSYGVSPDRPSNCCQLGHMQRFEKHQPEMVLVSDCFASQSVAWLKNNVPRACWYATSGPLPNCDPTEGDNRWPVFCSIPTVRDVLISRGVDPDRITMLGVATEQSIMQPVELDADEQEKLDCDVAILMDLPDISPDGPYVNLESHVRLFRTIVQMAPSWMTGYNVDQSDRILREAEKRSDRHLTDDDIRRRFRGLINEVIAPSVSAMDVAQRLMKARLRVKIWGRNWLLPPRYQEAVQGSIPDQYERNRIHNAAGLVYFPWFTYRTPLQVLDVIASGGRVVLRNPDNPDEASIPDVSGIISGLPSCQEPGEAIKVVSSILRDDAEVEKTFADLREVVLKEHTLQQRLEAIIKKIKDSV